MIGPPFSVPISVPIDIWLVSNEQKSKKIVISKEHGEDIGTTFSVKSEWDWDQVEKPLKLPEVVGNINLIINDFSTIHFSRFTFQRLAESITKWLKIGGICYLREIDNEDKSCVPHDIWWRELEGDKGEGKDLCSVPKYDPKYNRQYRGVQREPPWTFALNVAARAEETCMELLPNDSDLAEELRVLFPTGNPIMDAPKYKNIAIWKKGLLGECGLFSESSYFDEAIRGILPEYMGGGLRMVCHIMDVLVKNGKSARRRRGITRLDLLKIKNVDQLQSLWNSINWQNVHLVGKEPSNMAAVWSQLKHRERVLSNYINICAQFCAQGRRLERGMGV